MTKQEAIETLKYYQKWRLGTDDDIPMLEPKVITRALNLAVADLEKQKKSNIEKKLIVLKHQIEALEERSNGILLSKCTVHESIDLNSQLFVKHAWHSALQWVLIQEEDENK